MQGFAAKENPLSGRRAPFSGDGHLKHHGFSAAHPLIDREFQRQRASR
jgi:hypothetical protein